MGNNIVIIQQIVGKFEYIHFGQENKGRCFFTGVRLEKFEQHRDLILVYQSLKANVQVQQANKKAYNALPFVARHLNTYGFA